MPDPQTTEAPITSPAAQYPAPSAPPENHDAEINVADYLRGHHLDLAHVGYSDEAKGIEVTAKDKSGNLYTMTEKSLQKDLADAGHLPKDARVNFQPGSFNKPQSALNEVPTGLSYEENEKMAWSSDGDAAKIVLDKYGKDRVQLAKDGTAVAVQDPDNVWRKIAPDFHDDEGSWNWSNFVYTLQRHQKMNAEMLAATVTGMGVQAAATTVLADTGIAATAAEAGGVAAAAANYAPIAAGSVAGGAAIDAGNIAMGRIVGTTGEDPDQAAKTMALHAVINAALPGAAEMIGKQAVLPLIKGTLNKLGTMGSSAISTVSRMLSMFGEGNATAVEHSITHAGPVSAGMDAIESNATSLMEDAAENGRALNKYDATQQASADMVAQHGQAFSGDMNDAGRMSRNLNSWMDKKTGALIEGLDPEVKGALQQNVPSLSISAGQSFRNFLGAAGVPVNAAGRVAANDLSAAFGVMTPEESALAARSMNQGMATLEKLSNFNVEDPSAFKDLANMQASMASLKGTLSNSSLTPQAIQEAGKHLDNVATIMTHAIPTSFRNEYASLMREYADAAHATNYVMGSAVATGSSQNMTGAGTRVASLLTGSQGGNAEQSAMFNALMKITPGSEMLKTNLQTALSSQYMYNFSTAPTSTLGGAIARGISLPVRSGMKAAVMGLGKASGAADATADAIMNSTPGLAARQAANTATKAIMGQPEGMELKSALSGIASTDDFLDKTKLGRVMTAYGNYKVANSSQQRK